MAEPGYVDWFTKGARTLRELARLRGLEGEYPTDEDWYICPLCSRAFTIDELVDRANGGLSVEHVPPKRLGGKRLVLTCRRCNTSHGTRFDAEAVAEDRIRRFNSGQSGASGRWLMTVGDLTARVDAEVAGEGMRLMGLPQHTNPAHMARFVEHMMSMVRLRRGDFQFTLTPVRKYSPGHARVSRIRTAYLAAFALFGWSYILQPALVPVREQLANPATLTLPPLTVDDPDGEDERRVIWLIEEPVEHRSVLVLFGQHGVFLPVPDDARTLAQVADALAVDQPGGVSYSFTGKKFAWPAGPQHLLDPEPETEGSASILQ